MTAWGSAAIASTITQVQVLNSSILSNEANSLNCGRNNTVNGEHLEYLWASLSGDFGAKPAAAREPLELSLRSNALQGLLPSPSRTQRSDQALALCIGA